MSTTGTTGPIGTIESTTTTASTDANPTPALRAATSAAPHLEAAARSMMRAAHVPGLSIAVVDADRLLYTAGLGTADPVTAAPATPSSLYAWFSMSKLVTATAAMRLFDEGRLDLDVPVERYLAEVRSPGPRQPTVRDLLGHTAGLGNPLPVRWVHHQGAPARDPAELLHRLLRRRRAYRHPVGGPAHYSNVGYLALGQVIEAVTRLPFPTYVHQAVLAPTGMTATGYAYRPGNTDAVGTVRCPRVVDPLLRRFLPRGVVGPRQQDMLTLRRFSVDGPAYGGLIGDVLDAGRFLRLHLNDGELDGERVLSTTAARTMRVLRREGTPFDHALGWFRRPTDRDGDWLEHLGAGLGFWNVMRLYPDRGLGIVMMSNGTRRYDFEPLFELIARTSWS